VNGKGKTFYKIRHLLGPSLRQIAENEF
jgi:hypothetical protein